MTTTTEFSQVTSWSNPEEEIRTQFFDRGTYANWLHWELQRWAEKGREAWVQENAEGQVALFTYAEYMKPVGPEEQ